MAQAPQWMQTTKNVLAFSQSMTQAIWFAPQSSGKNRVGVSNMQSSLLQLPYFSANEVKHHNKHTGKSAGRNRDEDLRAYLRAPLLEKDGESFKRGQKDFTAEQRSDIEAVEKLLPDLDLDVTSGVDGEDHIVE